MSAPFAEPYEGPGRSYVLAGENPIDHTRPAPGILRNTTREPHDYHPGDVVHAIYEYKGGVWLYTEGRGLGGFTNPIVGRSLFGMSHRTATTRADLRTGGIDGHRRWQLK